LGLLLNRDSYKARFAISGVTFVRDFTLGSRNSAIVGCMGLVDLDQCGRASTGGTKPVSCTCLLIRAYKAGKKQPMLPSKSIAGLLGPTLIANGVAVLVNLNTWRSLAEQFTRDPVLIYIVGIAVFVTGLAIVQRHNVWRGWPVAVTVFGWLILVAGLVRMLFPVQLAEIAVAVVRAPGMLAGAVIVQLLIGAFFSYKAYGRG
jgi:hypothetical protein